MYLLDQCVIDYQLHFSQHYNAILQHVRCYRAWLDLKCKINQKRPFSVLENVPPL